VVNSRRDARIFSRRRQSAIEFSDSANYRPLTIVPPTSKPRRIKTGWVVATAFLILVAAILVARLHGIPAW
jgi:hypothetical protein